MSVPSEIAKHLVSLKLELNSKTALFPLKHGLTFLKWRYILTDTGKIVCLMEKKKIRRARSHFKKLSKAESNGTVEPGKTVQCLVAWISSAKYGNTETIIKNMNQYVGGIQNGIQ